jgi:putative copper resistance protein D
VDPTFALLAATRFAHFASAGALFGLVAFPFYAATPPELRLPRAVKWAGVLALLSAWAVLVMMAAQMGGSLGSAFDLQFLSVAVGDTAVGRVWIVRVLVGVALLARIVRPRPARDVPVLVLSGLLLASIALTGHSAMPGGWIGLLHRLADALHLLAAGWWIGGLAALALTARRLGPEVAPVLGRFSGVGYGAVAALILSGVFKTAVLVQPLSALVTSAYGRVLLVKLALFAGMLLLALSNRLQVTPMLAREPGGAALGRLQRQAGLEFALGIGVLAAVAALGAMAPPVSQ